ncbi:alpha-mannosidase [Geodermatophilus sp. SYSU D00710]
MHDHEATHRGRLGRVVEELLRPNLYRERRPLAVSAWPAPGEPVPFAEARRRRFEPFPVGSAWGPPWSTVWFHLTGQVPEAWRSLGDAVEVVVDLGFRPGMPDGQAEGLAHRPDGSVVKAVQPRSRHLPVDDLAGGRVDLYVEAAANPVVTETWSWHPTPFGDPATAPSEPLYVLRQADVAVRAVEVAELLHDVEVLAGLADELPADLPRRAELLRALDRAVDRLDPDDVPGTAADARAALAPALARPAHASAHRVLATGHAHIDSAWLWPVRETVRKCVRTFANVLDLLDRHEDLVFSCSSAQQWAWVQEHAPDLWARMAARAAEGRFVPVGGMWVEADTNMPGSEALARQFVLGRRYFLTELGIEPEDVWLPDSFGYSAALPQVATAAGARWFLTQKLSWNDTNRLPHSTFLWEGVDGTRLFTHCPPVDTYSSELTAAELARAQRHYREAGHGSTSLVPFGHGDGGGGPTREMLARARRTADLEGSPRVRLGTVADFFTAAEAELPAPAVWSGELYLETHRGVYTSQLRTKQGNRRSEHLLRAAELWATTATVRAGVPYPARELAGAWRTVLLQQFHDVLPGSSIAWVHREAEAGYARVRATLEAVVERSLAALAGPGDLPLTVNSAPVPLAGVPALSVAVSEPGTAAPVTAAEHPGGGWVLDNGVLRVEVDGRGLLTSVVDLALDREVVPAGRAAGLLRLHDDRPARYEAWDVDRSVDRRVRDLTAADTVELTGAGDGAAVVATVRRTGRSTVRQETVLRAGVRAVDLHLDVDWHERRSLLTLEFPVDVHAERAASEIQFGHVYRPTHENTSWDAARFETCAHRWVHVGEPGFGVAVANDSTYGHAVRRERPDRRGPAPTVIRLSLLRAPRFPDPDADQGRHRLTVSLVCGTDLAGALAEGQRLNQPVRHLTGARPVAPLVRVEDPGVLVEAVKTAEDGSGDVVVRLYEALGRRTRTRLLPGFGCSGVVETDLLERAVPPRAVRSSAGNAGGAVELEVRPFQIVTLRFTGVTGD